MGSPVDIIIIGGGFGGLSAASSIVRQGHSIVIFDSGQYRNSASQYMHTLPSWDHRDPKEFRAAARRDLERYGKVELEELEVSKARKRDDGIFEATTSDGQVFTGRKLILATGVEDVFPDIPGYADCWGKAIFHCLYCHGWEETGAASSGLLALGGLGDIAMAMSFARQGLRFTKNVTIYTHGNEQITADLQAVLDKTPVPISLEPRPIAKVTKGPERAQIVIHFEDGTSRTEGFLAHKPKARVRGLLAEQLGIEQIPGGILKVTPPLNQTNIKGVYAAGDVSSPIQTVTSALYTGMLTGGGAPLQLQAEMMSQEPSF